MLLASRRRIGVSWPRNGARLEPSRVSQRLQSSRTTTTGAIRRIRVPPSTRNAVARYDAIVARRNGEVRRPLPRNARRSDQCPMLRTSGRRLDPLPRMMAQSRLDLGRAPPRPPEQRHGLLGSSRRAKWGSPKHRRGPSVRLRGFSSGHRARTPRSARPTATTKLCS